LLSLSLSVYFMPELMSTSSLLVPSCKWGGRLPTMEKAKFSWEKWAHLLSHVSWWLSLITFCEYFVSVSLTFLHIVMWFLFVRYLRPCSKRDMGSLLHDAGRKIYLLSLRVGAAAALPASCDFHANFIRCLAKSSGYFILRRRRLAVCLNSSRRFPFRTRSFFSELAETVAIWNVDSRSGGEKKHRKSPHQQGSKVPSAMMLPAKQKLQCVCLS